MHPAKSSDGGKSASWVKRSALSGLLLLAGCSVVTVPASAPSLPDQPGELRGCSAAPAGVKPPPPPRTFDVVVAWGQKAEDLRAQTARVAAECRERLGRLNRWIDDVRLGR